MNAYVEVATAKTVVETLETNVVTTTIALFFQAAIREVAASTQRVLDMLRYSIENVAPNTFALGGTA